MIRYLLVGVPVAAVAAGFAFAPGLGCPGAQDLDDGIVFRSDVQTYVVADLGEGLMWRATHSAMFPDTWNTYSFQGLFDVYKIRESGAMETEYSYPSQLNNMFPLKTGDTHRFGEVATNHDRALTWDFSHEMKVERKEQVSIGRCRYSALNLRFESRFERSDGMRRNPSMSRVYLPELKTSFRAGSQFFGSLLEVRKRRLFDQAKPGAVPEQAVEAFAAATGALP